ncbi:Nuclear transport factor 2 [Quillaja saponaria]|uniref:NTF2-related export protein n=1 Tax=Quillaja saponaria TaxID=32244 RepID=A0AAD7KUE3_QUISA|nr:Nuclear transport factor 2 [Quillaja saponaria]
MYITPHLCTFVANPTGYKFIALDLEWKRISLAGFTQVVGMEEQLELVGKDFVNHYYHLFDTDRASMSSLYQPNSMLTFEGQNIIGVDEITSKLNQLPFDQCRHAISTIDSQPSSSAGGIVVFVSGSLQLLGEEHPLRFS